MSAAGLPRERGVSNPPTVTRELRRTYSMTIELQADSRHSRDHNPNSVCATVLAAGAILVAGIAALGKIIRRTFCSW